MFSVDCVAWHCRKPESFLLSGDAFPKVAKEEMTKMEIITVGLGLGKPNGIKQVMARFCKEGSYNSIYLSFSFF